MRTILIADDEQHICLELKYIIEKEKGIKIIKICSTGTEALEQICKIQPEIVFLDIEMPGINGIQLGHYLRKLTFQPYIVYVTAYDRFAIEAFRVGAKGYILKPFSEEDVREQIQQAVRYLEQQHKLRDKGEMIPKTKLAVEINGKFQLLDHSAILFAFAHNRSVFVRTNENKFLTDSSLVELESYFNPEVFIRCHRNYIVNITKIKEIIPWFNSTYMLVMEDKTNIPVSRAHIKYIKKIFCL